MHLLSIIAILMPSSNIDNLIRELSQIRIRRERAIHEVKTASSQETLLLRRLHASRLSITPPEHNNIHKRGDRASKSTTHSRLIDIQDPTTNKKYKWTWWNLEAVANEAQ